MADTADTAHTLKIDPDTKTADVSGWTFLSVHFLVILCHGQLLSLSIVSTNTMTTLMNDHHVSIPAFQSLINYALLLAVFVPYSLYKMGVRAWTRTLRADAYKFFLFALADVEGNYFVVKAYQYTNVLSAALLDNFAIVVVVALSFLFLRVRYHWTQFLGIVMCIGGLALLVVSDRLTHKDYDAVNHVKGDLFVLLGAACYGVSNVLQEYYVSKRPIYEVLGLVGLFGVVINGVQAAIFDRDAMAHAQWSPMVGGYLAIYTASLFFLYCTTPVLMRMSSAAFYNLSLLTSDFWSLLIGIRVFGYYVFWLYPVGFVCTILGIVVYYVAPHSRREAVKPWLRPGEGVDGVGVAAKQGCTSSSAQPSVVWKWPV